jgi:hypothetical protein
LGAVTDNGDGTYTATLTSSSTAGTATISGTLAGGAITDTATVAFTTGSAPVITGPSGGVGASASTISVDEEQTAVAQITANEVVSWAITGGNDAIKFSIASDGTITFVVAPDYETPSDSDVNNTYELVVTATDTDNNSSSQIITVTVRDVDLPGAPLSSGLDADGDGTADALESSSADRDGDGIPDAQDYDPQGYFYCQADGRILPGGHVSVIGPGNVNMVKDGTATGEYQWFVDAPGTYTMIINTSGMAFPNIAASANPTPLILASRQDNPIIVGSLEDGSTGYLGQFNGAPYDPITPSVYYTEFVIAEGDANVYGNNIPFEGCALNETGDDLIEEIREPLSDVLEADMERIIERQSRVFSDLARNALDRLQTYRRNGVTEGPWDGVCGQQRPFDVDGVTEIGEKGLEALGTFSSENYDCGTGDLVLTYGEFAVSDRSSMGAQGTLSFGFAREKHHSETMHGRFWGGYITRSDIETSEATGVITGIGVNAGLYRAKLLGADLFLDYFAAAALGRHQYELQFSDQIRATGSYGYVGVFAGAALSGEKQFYNLAVRPRAGFDLGYGVASNASVRVSDASLTGSGAIQLDPAKGMQAYLEADFAFGQNFDESNRTGQEQLIQFTPRLFCEEGFGERDARCGYGLAIVFGKKASLSAPEWRMALDYEQTRREHRIAVKIARERQILAGAGSVSTGLDVGVDGRPAIHHRVDISW